MNLYTIDGGRFLRDCNRDIPLQRLDERTLYEQIESVQDQYVGRPNKKYIALLTDDDMQRLLQYEEFERFVSLQQSATLTMDNPPAVLSVLQIYSKGEIKSLNVGADASRLSVVAVRWYTDANKKPCSGQAYERSMRDSD